MPGTVSARNADICEGSETMSTTEREVRMIEQPGMGPSKKASGRQASYLHSMGRALQARNMRTPTKASGNRAAYLHSMGRAPQVRNMRTNN